ARDVHVLPQLDEADHHPRVLAVRDLSCAGHLDVLLQDRQHLLAGGRALGAERTVEGAQHVGLEAPVRLHAELLDGVRDGRAVVPPSALGARAELMPGSSSLSITTESPMRSSACMILPPGPGMRAFSRAPNARA